jgi:hypothetical protein
MSEERSVTATFDDRLESGVLRDSSHLPVADLRRDSSVSGGGEWGSVLSREQLRGLCLCSQSKEAEGGGDREGHRRRERDQSTDLLFTVFVLDRGHIVDLRHVRRDGRAGEGDLHDEEHEGHEGDQTQRAEESSISRGNPHTIHQSILPLPRERQRQRERERERETEIERQRDRQRQTETEGGGEKGQPMGEGTAATSRVHS